jgi:hypothetical protein
LRPSSAPLFPPPPPSLWRPDEEEEEEEEEEEDLSFSVVERILEESESAPIWLQVCASIWSGDFSFFESG